MTAWATSTVLTNQPSGLREDGPAVFRGKTVQMLVSLRRPLVSLTTFSILIWAGSVAGTTRLVEDKLDTFYGPL
jgi:hypothetical protein